MKAPRCKCGKRCQYYGPIGGYSVACKECNANNAKRQREARTNTTYNKSLLAGIKALTNPDFHELNKYAGRNDRLLHAVLCAYAKHHLDSDEIGWEKLGEILHAAICNEVGDGDYCAWVEQIKSP